MVLSTAKIVLILLALFNLIIISVCTIIGKNKISLALAILEAFLVTSATYFD